MGVGGDPDDGQTLFGTQQAVGIDRFLTPGPTGVVLDRFNLVRYRK